MIVTEGESADSFYMIVSGTVSVWKDKDKIRNMGEGDSFGEQALYISSVRQASVRAETEVFVLSLGRTNIVRILGGKVQSVVFSNLQRWAFEKKPLLKQLTKLQLEKIAQHAKHYELPRGQALFQKNEKVDKLIVMLEGNLIRGGEKQVVICDKGELFGDHYLD